MYDDTDCEIAAIGIRLLDDAYLAWVTAASEASRALRSWLDRAPRDERAYAAYRAALDREEAAAVDLQRLWAVATPCRHALEDPAVSRGRQGAQ
jgi:hypothetical protein